MRLHGYKEALLKPGIFSIKWHVKNKSQRSEVVEECMSYAVPNGKLERKAAALILTCKILG